MAGQGRGQATTWPRRAAARARAAGLSSPADLLAPLLEKLKGFVEAERGPGRLILWCPIAFGLGVALYFAASREPLVWAGFAAAIPCLIAAAALRRRALAFAACMLAAAVALGFSAATWRSAAISHPVLQRPLFDAQIEGWVLVREERERTDRIVVVVHQMQARRLEEPLQRIRVSVRKGLAPQVGSFVAFKARLSPPLPPLRPGGYDFARDLYFQKIGATGFVLGKIEPKPPPAPAAWPMQYRVTVSGVRDAIDARIRSALPGDTGAIASALITGKRDAISAPVNEAMYVSSLAHVLSISGYHMAVVAGVIFFLVRGLLALSPALALRAPIKKWAAFAALVGATGYLVLSGAEIATQRAYVMTAVVLIGVILDRPALTLRTLAIAALVLLALSPESVVHPSFQMSFAATLALIAAYERGLPWMSAGADTSLGARIALWGGREVTALLVASMVAGAATTIYAAYHFHRLAPYGVLANIAAMPVVSAWVMPTGLLALVAAPFGLDAFFWRLMGMGIEWMIGVAMWVASLPGAVGRVAAFGVGPMLAATAGLFLICLLRSPLRWSGAVVIAGAILAAARTLGPDVLVAPGGEAVAIRTESGRLSMLKIGSDTFAMRQWLAADGDARSPGDPSLRDGLACDASGCIGRLADGRRVAVVLAPDAFAEDCRRAALIVTRRTAPPDCTVAVIDRPRWLGRGAFAATITNGKVAIHESRPKNIERPWARAGPAGGADGPAPVRDATPRDEDREAGD